MMRKRILLVVTILAGLVTTMPAHASVRGDYLRLYKQVQARHGHRAPGRNIARWGLPNGHRAKRADLKRSIGVLERMLQVVKPTYTTTQGSPGYERQTPVTSTVSPTSGGAGGTAACIRQRESGGNYSTNTGNGYYGAYQFLPGTWQFHVEHPHPLRGWPVRADLASPAQQTFIVWRTYIWDGRSFREWGTAGGCGLS